MRLTSFASKLVLLSFTAGTGGLAAGLAAQAGEAESRERALAKVRQQLEQKPTHPSLFEYYFKLLVETNTVDKETEALAEKLAASPGAAAQSIVLGRLYLRAGKEQKALETLDAITTKTPEIQGVLGDIYFKLARHDQAARAFTAALPSAVTSEAKAQLFERIGRSELALGRKAEALATWQRIGELDDGKFHRRLRVAELLTDAGVLVEAEQAYAPLLAEAASDIAQHCRVLRDVGRLQELQGTLERALATYEAVLGKTARGNWLRKEVEGRVVQIYRRQAKLDALVARLEEQQKEQPDDLALTELLADVYLETKKRDRATAVLAAAAPRFPRDVRLARKLAQLFVEQGDTQKAIAEYQRILTEKPDELDLYLELGQLFAKGAQLDEAKLQWERALAKRLQDATLCARIAGMYATFEREADAVRLFERAIEIEPDSMSRYTDLADYLFGRGKTEAGVAILERAITAAAGKPRRLEAIVGALRERGLDARAEQALDAILQAEPNNHEARHALAELWLTRGDEAKAAALLWQVLDADDATGDGQRTRAANALVQLANKSDQTAQLTAQAEQRASAGAAFLLGRLHSRAREFDAAIAAFKLALERKPQDVEARRLLARLLADQGDFQGALGEYARIAQIQPGEGKRQFREVARLHLETFDVDQAIEVWRKAMRDNPDNAAVFLEVGREFLGIMRMPEALEAFQQAARLKVDDPDIQFRLADALRQSGQPEDAEKVLQGIVARAADARDREQARARVFDLIAEQGLIDKRIEALTATVRENPYDQQAAQQLADLYLRTGDLVLGLEMVDRTLQFQAKNVELLQRRVAILEALEEWDKARTEHEELLKLPGTERDLHLAGIGQALYESGRAAEAKTVFEKIQDRGRVVDFYKKYELREEAIEFFKRAIARNPGDLRSCAALAEQLLERNRQDEALAVLERALVANPMHRRSLELIGKLYVQVGRRDEAVQCGMRLFGLRGEETEATRREEFAAEQAAGQSRSWRPSMAQFAFGQQRIQAAQAFFEERGLQEEWGKLLVAEAKRRPADESLFQAVQSHYGWRDKSPQKLAAFVQELLARDWSKVRIPPGYTLRSYRAMLESTLLGTYSQDAATAQARVAALAGERPPAEVLERALLQLGLGQRPAVIADLRAVLAAEPGNPIAMALLAEQLLEDKQPAEAATWLGKVVEFWDSPAGARAQAELDQRAALAFQRSKRQAYDAFPRKLRRQITDEQLVAERKLVLRDDAWRAPRTIAFAEAVPSRFATTLKQLRAFAAAGDATGVTSTLARASEQATTLARRTALGVALFEEQRKDDAIPLLTAVLAEEEPSKRNPIRAYQWSSYAGLFNEAARCLGLIRAEQGDALAAYGLLRGHGLAQQAELVLRKQAKVEDVRALLEQAVATAETKLREQRATSAGDISTFELDYRDEVIKLADFLLGEKDFAGVDALYEKSLTLLSDDLEIRGVLAALRLRQGEVARALATHEDILGAKRRKKRARQVEAALPPARLQPSLPDTGSGSGGGTVYRVGNTTYYRSGSTAASYEVSETYQQILAIHTTRNDAPGVLATLERIQREDPATFRNMAYEVVNQVRNLDMGKERMSILRALRSAVTNDEWLMREYCRACIDVGELLEARRSLEKLIATTTAANSWVIEEAEQMLQTVAQRLGEAKLTVDDLRRKVEAEPDNVRHRTEYVLRLLKERRYADALTHAEFVLAKAPHLPKAKENVINAACAAGADARAREVIQKLYTDTAKPAEKVQRGVAYANWLFAEGKRDEAFAIVDGLEVQSGGNSSEQFSAGNWYLDRHELARATARLAAELDKQKGQQYYADRIRARLARTEFASGAVAQAVQRHLEAIRTATSLGDREQRFKDLLGALTSTPDAEALTKQLAKHEARASIDDLLVTTALAFARRDPTAAIAEIEKALALSTKEVHLFPLLYGLRKLQGDYEGALQVLERMANSYGGSESMRYTGSDNYLSEKDQLKLERAALLDELGRQAEADAVVEAMHDATKPESMRAVASAYKERKRWDKALEWRRRYTEKSGRRDADALTEEAALLLEQADLPAALTLLAEAQLMAKDHARARELLYQVHRKAGTLADYAKTLEADYAKDPRSAPVRDQLLTIYKDLRQNDRVKAIYTRMRDDPALEETALRALLELAERQGDREGQLPLLQRLLAIKGGEEKRERHGALARAYQSLGRVAEATEHKRASLELDSADGQRQLGWWLRYVGDPAGARAAIAKALEIDPEGDATVSAALEDAWQSREYARFLEFTFKQWEKQFEPFQIGDQGLRVVEAWLALPQAERARWLPGDGSTVGKERAAALHLARGEVAPAKALLDEVLAAEPRRPLALRLAIEIAQGANDRAELLRLLRQLHDLIERQHVVQADWRVQSAAQSAWSSIGTVLFAQGNLDAAEQVWKTPALRRSPVSYSSGSYRYDGNVPYATEQWLAHDQPERALRALDVEFLMRESAPWQTYWQVLTEAEQRERAERSAWQALLDPLRLYGVREQSRSWTWDAEAQESTVVDPAAQFLVSSYEARGALPELEAEYQRLAAAPATRLQAYDLRQALLSVTDNWRLRAEVAEERLVLEPDNSALRMAAAVARARVGDGDKALAHLGEVFDLQSPALQQPARALSTSRSSVMRSVGNRMMTIGGMKNPFSFSFQSSGGSTTWYGGSGSSFEGYRTTAALVLRLSGQANRAAELEADLIALAAPGDGRMHVCSGLAHRYQSAKLYADALRLLRQAIAEAEANAQYRPAVEGYDPTASTLQQAVLVAKLAGDSASHAELLARQRTALEAAVQKVQGRAAFGERQALAMFLVRGGGDPAGGLALLDALVAESGCARPFAASRALALRKLGRFAEAIAAHESLHRHAAWRRPDGAKQPPTKDVEYGLALAGAGDAAARAILEPALRELRTQRSWRDPEADEREAEIQAALAKLPE
jgi:tetratricopeptide (TPR) repeat protein